MPVTNNVTVTGKSEISLIYGGQDNKHKRESRISNENFKSSTLQESLHK